MLTSIFAANLEFIPYKFQRDISCISTLQKKKLVVKVYH